MTLDCWAVLGIEPTDSTRDVRRAYADKLRQTRPDDDPEGFQRLHAAYKTALAIAERGVEPELSPASSSLDWFDVDEVDVVDENLLNDAQISEIERLVEHMNGVLNSELKVHKPEYWRFFSESASLLDDRFRIELGRRVLDGIVEYHERIAGEKRRRHDRLSSVILGHLDEVFFWSSAPHRFVEPENLSAVYELLSDIDTGYRSPTADPVGGHIVRQYGDNQNRDVQTSTDNFSGWEIFACIWLVIAALRGCEALL